MLSKLFTFILVLTLMELAFIIWIGKFLGVLNTILLILGVGVIGVYLAKMAGWQLISQIKSHVQKNTLPENTVMDALLIFCGGLLFLLPGFLTDILAILMILPFTRPVIRTILRKY